MTSKRQFLAATTLAAIGGTAGAATTKAGGGAGPGLLTVTGSVRNTNRGPLDKALDQMMVKQQQNFTRAHVFDFAALQKLPARTIRPTLEYDNKVHALRGPLLTEVLRAAGAPEDAATPLAMRAIDGYTIELSLGEARKLELIVATHLDGKPMPLGGLGPLWAVLDADRNPELAAKPVTERFAKCPWGLYHVVVGT
ncbi:molybdopterin-dependent oxidoreductase [Ottowia thiooxydans]|uniref:molybdopterin-dependent oxidoreductase n=1 Tax=Ottowia thiooxydans TaxID=219182 RepID=UPI00040A3E4B|nr:molybdopterin-dependent oxidoreductase [Ottowia thiooxydans]